MYKLFIVDDEPSARHGLRDFFDWSRYGIEVVGEADDGINALEPISKLKPDIVITDVKMPEMDGIEFSRRLRESYKEMNIIFISGYDDVEYLRSALKVDAIDYILKPINLEELDNIILKVIDVIEHRKKQKELFYQMEVKLLQSMPLLKEKFFTTLIQDQYDNINEVKEKMDFLDINLPITGRLCLFIVNIDDKAYFFESFYEKEKQLFSFSVLNICQELLENFFDGYAFENRLGEYVLVLSLGRNDEEESLLELAKEIKNMLGIHLQASVTIGVGGIVTNILKLPHSYKIAMEAVQQKLFLGKNQIIFMNDFETNTTSEYKFDFLIMDKLVSVLKGGEKNRLVSFLNDIFDEISKSSNVDLIYCRNICLNLLLIPSRLLKELDINNEKVNREMNQIWQELFKAETLDDMKTIVIEHFKEVSEFIHEKRDVRSNNIIEYIKKIIEERYAETLTVADIASEVYLTSTYVCLIFKQETGETVNEYLTKVRVNRAKEMLKDPSNKFYSIAEAVGYSDPSYFTKLFKKYTGLTPSQYRESL